MSTTIAVSTDGGCNVMDLPKLITPAFAKRIQERAPDVTLRQYNVLAYITAYYEQEGVPPTLTEICEAHGWASLNAAQTHCKALEKRGLLRKTKRGYLPT